MKLIEFPVVDSEQAYPPAPALPDFDAQILARHGADAHYLVLQGEAALARASLWWREVPQLERERLGVVGHFTAVDAAAAALLLERVLERLKQQDCTLAVGPMDGNTWRSYRFISDPGDEPPFFLEPQNPAAYPQYFIDAGFTPLADYSSSRVTDLGWQDPRIGAAIKRLEANGLQWRPLNPDDFETELRAIYRLSTRCFTRNFLYTPIAEDEFVGQYRAVEPYVQPQLTLLAERDGELLGYLFGIPDLNQAQRGEAVDSFIVKTVAALASRHSAGLGSVLVAESHRIAQTQGFRQAIHALMHDGNLSRNISSRYAHRMRRYRLYQQRLAPSA